MTQLERAQLTIELLQKYGRAKFGDEWWPGNAVEWIGRAEGLVLQGLLNGEERKPKPMTPAEAMLHQQGVTEGIVMAAQELMDRLRDDAGVRDDNWPGGDVVPVVDRWLQDHGVDTSVPEDEDEDEDGDEPESLSAEDRAYARRLHGFFEG